MRYDFTLQNNGEGGGGGANRTQVSAAANKNPFADTNVLTGKPVIDALKSTLNTQFKSNKSDDKEIKDLIKEAKKQFSKQVREVEKAFNDPKNAGREIKLSEGGLQIMLQDAYGDARRILQGK